ncbi:filamentous hemagglutinin outer membrane protein [Calothrix parasitica NIES-267]|uniref:Filamentous hemagglutinin outer membrane protein n=1 Tax=Calothrix parasitica NIES-267 TaxID=1973488 RepID=A0A1Z4LK84_9CYAN|nr:filamentous hemagglutinin outer membrane protein [Calothrix parasitica NIES-267]
MLNHYSLVNLLWRSALILNISSFTVVFGNSAFAQIEPDNTLGSENSLVSDIDAFNKRIDGGVKLDANLFHSFREFNVSKGRSVYFANPEGVTDIFSRVTGNNPSNIFGKLGVLGDANLFLINPNGIVFGENASLDVNGSFVATTANGIEFGKQGSFSTSNPEIPRLLSVNPSALFFNAVNNQAGIQNNSVAPAGKDPAGINAFGLRVADGKSLLLVGGNVSIDGGQLNAFGGRVELGGLAAPGNVNLLFEEDNLKLAFPENVARADVLLTNQAFVSVEADGGGDIAVNTRNLDILRGSKLSAGIGQGLGSSKAIAGDTAINQSGINNLVQASSITGGNIVIDTSSLNLQDGAQISSSILGNGNAGNVIVKAKESVSLNNSTILSTVEAGGTGKGGNIDISAATLKLLDGSQLQTITRGASDTQPAAKGDAGDINLKVSGTVDIFSSKGKFISGLLSFVETGTQGNGGNLNIDAGSFNLGKGSSLAASTLGNGNAGNVRITANDAVLLTEGDIFSTVEAGGIGKGGNIDINAATLTLRDGAQLQTITRRASDTQSAGKGDAGNINLKVSGTVDISGKKGEFISGLFSFVGTGAEGNGGNITVDAGSFNLGQGTRLSASTSGKGNAGNVVVSTKDAVSLIGGNIFSAVEAGGVGKGGNIDINAANLTLRDGAQLITIIRSASDTQPPGKGNAGDINLKVSGTVDIAGREVFSSGLSSLVQAGVEGNGGDITVDAGFFRLTEGARLNASASGKGNAGNVVVKAKDSIFLTGGNIFSTVEARGVGEGGNIDINAANLTLRDGAKLAASTLGNGNAGDVTISAKDTVFITDGSIFSTVEAGGVGEGGNIDINAANLTLRNGAQLQTITRGASSTQPPGKGDAGDINLKVSGTVDIAGKRDTVISGIFSLVQTGTEGNGGNITVNAGSLKLGEDASLSASTAGKGNAGNASINVEDAVSLTGGSIFSTVEAEGIGKGGDINISASTFLLEEDARLAASTFGNGNAGNIRVNTQHVAFLTGGSIFSAVEAGGVGKGGNIDIDAANLVLKNGAQLSPTGGRWWEH